MSSEQLALINGFYRCHNCRRDVSRVLRTRRFRLCPECWAMIIEPMNPGKTGDLTPEEYQARDNYWRWYGQMEKEYPAPRNWARSQPAPLLVAAADLYPFCRCGNLKRETPFLLGDRVRGLFGGPYFDKCPICEAKAAIDSMFRMRAAVFQNKDDEEILDQLQRTFPEFFKLGVLPGYWFDLRMSEQ